MDTVKSARRVFEFLEYFAKVERDVSVAELANHYDFPNSSVSSLMRTMVSMGYLSYDARRRTYLPTARLPFLVNWVGTKLFQHDRIRRVMEELSEATGETIMVGIQNGIRVQYIHVVDATGPIRLHAEAGDFRPIALTAMGQLMLSAYDDAHVGRIVRRINADEPDAGKHIALAPLLEKLNKIRADDYALSIGGTVPGGGAVACFLPEHMNDHRLVLAIGSGEYVLTHNIDRFVALMKDAIERHFSASNPEA
jgi:DNA-binding IclR family transcriptional regulator